MTDIKTTPAIPAWFIELVQRFGQKTPAFFKWLGYAGAAAAAIMKLPDLLSSVNIALPASWVSLQSNVVFWCGIVVTIVSNLAVQRPLVTSTDDTAHETLAKKLPFTTKNETPIQQAANEAAQEVAVNETPLVEETPKEDSDITKELAILKAEVAKLKAAKVVAKKVTKTTKNDNAKK